MSYKIIQNGNIVDVGYAFLYVDPRGLLLYCDTDKAQLLQGFRQDKLYHPYWLENVNMPETVTYEDAEAVMIDDAEYAELVEQLMDGEDIPVPDPDPGPAPEPEPDPEPDPDPQRPMTIAEMRSKILEMEETLNIILGVVE